MILPLDGTAASRSEAGAKARTLGRLRAAGFPVPDGFIVTRSEDAQGGDLAAAFNSLADRSGSTARFAIRSSGRAEDSTAASFAGQFETVLGARTLPDVAAAIVRCFASFSIDRARTYQQAMAVREFGGAVIIQHLIEADAAGVAFTVDPVTGATDRIVIDAASGPGEAVVGGRLVPDGFAVEKATRTVVARRVAGLQPCITDAAAAAIADLALRVEDVEGRPVDVEWAWADGCVHLLQARPVTTAPAVGSEPPPGWTPELNTRIDPRFPLYSNGNVGEILPGCVAPLTYGFFARGVERAFRDVAETIGSMPDVGPDPIVVGFFFHRVYLNVSYFMTAADNSPGATRDAVYEELIGRPPIRHPAWNAGDILVPWRLWRGLRMIARFLVLQKRLDADMTACRAMHETLRRQFQARPPAEWTNDELASWMIVDEAGLQPALVHIRASQFASSSFNSLRGMTRTSLGDETGAIAAALVAGIGSIATASPVAALYELAAIVRAEPTLRDEFDRDPDDARLLARVRASADARRFCDVFDEFVDRFGHRGFREADFRSPSWREKPVAIMAQIRSSLASGNASPVEIAARQSALAAEARKAALPRIPWWKRGFFDGVLTAARAHIAARETMKDLLLRFFDLSRIAVAAASKRLPDALDQPDDVHFLLPAELADALRGRLAADAVRAIVKRRRRDFTACELIDVPKVQDGTPRWISAPKSAEGAAVAELTGVPVSPGVFEGRARLIHDPGDAPIEPGDVLVAPVTDAAWTPLFLRASALVVEVGGPLSHGSIVAREFGLPAVTAVAGAMQRIRTGDRVRVDGGRGTVSVLERP